MYIITYNLGQKIVDKFTKLSKISFLIEWYTADFSRIFSTNVKICLLDGRLGTCHQIQAFQGFSWNFPIS